MNATTYKCLLYFFLFLHLNLFAEEIIPKKNTLIGICGGSASGKTTFSNKLMENYFGRAVLIHQDDYYKPLANVPLTSNGKPNFACPEAVDFDLLKKHLVALKNNAAIDSPVYSFITCERERFSLPIQPKEIILVEGFLLFAVPEIREILDLKLYIDTDDDIRLLRRIERDIKERGRSFEMVVNQYFEEVKPMHKAFVEPSKQYADIIIKDPDAMIKLIEE